MKRILVALLLLTVFVGIGNSKNFSVVGVVVDSLENEPVPYATLRVDKRGGTEPTLGISGVDGAFDEKLAEPGVYTLTVSGTGMRNVPLNSRWATRRVCATSDAWRLFPALSLKRSAWWRRSLW